MSRDTLTFRCARTPWCNNLIEFRKGQFEKAALYAAGWICRGTQMGWRYYCHQCAPRMLADERSREK